MHLRSIYCRLCPLPHPPLWRILLLQQQLMILLNLFDFLLLALHFLPLSLLLLSSSLFSPSLLIFPVKSAVFFSSPPTAFFHE